MAANAEVDCNDKDYTNEESEGNILIFIREVALFTALAGEHIKPTRYFRVSGNCV